MAKRTASKPKSKVCTKPKTVKVGGKTLKLRGGKPLTKTQAAQMAAGVRIGGGSASVRKNPCGGGFLLYFSKTK